MQRKEQKQHRHKQQQQQQHLMDISIWSNQKYLHWTLGSMLAHGTGWSGFFFLKLVTMIPSISWTLFLAMSVIVCVRGWSGRPWMMEVLPAAEKSFFNLHVAITTLQAGCTHEGYNIKYPQAALGTQNYFVFSRICIKQNKNLWLWIKTFTKY